jgi:hypothetical protein
MRTSLNEIKLIENYLDNTLRGGDRLLFEARMLVSKELRQNVALQRKVYSLVQHHHGVLLRKQFSQLHREVFNDPSRSSIKEEVNRLF